MATESDATGYLDHVSSEVERHGDVHRRIWHARLDPRSLGQPVYIIVGEWFPAALIEEQKVSVTGRLRDEGEIEVTTLTDSHTHAIFAPGGNGSRGTQLSTPLVGSANDVFDLQIGSDPPVGYTFRLRDEKQELHTVVMRGFRRKGTPLDVGTKVRVHGSRGGDNVVYSPHLEYLDSEDQVIGSLRILGPGIWKLLWITFFALALLAFASIPWVTPMIEGAPSWVGLIWTGFCLLVFLAVGVRGFVEWRRIRG